MLFLAISVLYMLRSLELNTLYAHASNIGGSVPLLFIILLAISRRFINPTNFKAMIYDSSSNPKKCARFIFATLSSRKTSNKKIDIFGNTKKRSLDKEIEGPLTRAKKLER